MATKTKPRPQAKTPPPPIRKSASLRPTASSAKPPSGAKPALPITTTSPTELPRTPPASLEEFVQHIKILGKRMEGHVGFMCSAEKLTGTSSEAKLKYLTQFYSRLFGFEHELSRIRDELQLG